MRIQNFKVFATGFRPPKASVKAIAILSEWIFPERFEAIAGRYFRTLEIFGDFKLSSSPAGGTGDVRKSLDAVSFAEGLGIGALEGSNHLIG